MIYQCKKNERCAYVDGHGDACRIVEGPHSYEGDISNEIRLRVALDATLAELKAERAKIRPGGVFRHYKGGLYSLLTVADYVGRDAQPEGFPEGTPLVIYLGLYDNPHGNRPCARTVSEFCEPVTHNGIVVPRFAQVEDRPNVRVG